MDLILVILGFIAFMFLVAVPYVWGVADLYTAYRFKRNSHADKTAFYLNWVAFKWSWTGQSKALVDAFPHFQKDLTENFGIRPDDGKIT